MVDKIYKILDKIDDIIKHNIPEILAIIVALILLILVSSIPVTIYVDYKIRSRAMDIYENQGVEININDLDKIMKGE